MGKGPADNKYSITLKPHNHVFRYRRSYRTGHCRPRRAGNKYFTIEAPFTQELRIDQSIAHNGVCLTVVELEAPHYTVTAIRETLIKSNLGELREGDLVNLERSMRPDALLDGHIVQGHVDQTARCTAIT